MPTVLDELQKVPVSTAGTLDELQKVPVSTAGTLDKGL